MSEAFCPAGGGDIVGTIPYFGYRSTNNTMSVDFTCDDSDAIYIIDTYLVCSLSAYHTTAYIKNGQLCDVAKDNTTYSPNVSISNGVLTIDMAYRATGLTWYYAIAKTLLG